MTDWQGLENKYFMRTFKRLPVTIVRGEGVRMWDDNGKEYLDFIGGWAVNVLGHSHPVVVEALTTQARMLMHTSNQVYTVPQVQLAQMLVENSCLDRVFFCNSGAEASEGAVKLARRYGKLNLKGAYEVITATKSFHGRTLAMTAATGQAKFQEPYMPLPEGFVNVEYNNLDAVKKATTGKTCAVMLEPIQGEGGVNVPSADYLKGVRRWCDERNIVLILDEVQTGMGRNGTLFAYEQFGVEPDIMTLAKGLGGGFPIGAILAKDRFAVFKPGEHGSTFGGNPLACAVACAVFRYILDNDVVGNCRRIGKYLFDSLERLRAEYDCIVDVRGRGLLQAVEFNAEIAETLVRDCLQSGLLLNAVNPGAIRFMPPLIVGEGEVDAALSKVEKIKSP